MVLLDYLTVYEYSDKIRLGGNTDGGYVIANIDGYDSYISAGIGTYDPFSIEFIEKYKLDYTNSFGFDGTITKLPEVFPTNMSYIKKNISKYVDAYNDNLSAILLKYNNIFLKMDIEGAEFEYILSLTTEQLKKFKQIVVEVHGINDDSYNSKYEDKSPFLKKLNDTHYLIHAHCNNSAGVTFNEEYNIPNVLELTYILKDIVINQPKLNTTPLPILDLDYSCNPYMGDYSLNFPPFTNPL